MFSIRVDGLDEFLSQLRGFERQAPFALASALTRLAGEVRDEERKTMMRVFDRPTPFTLNSLMMTPAKKTALRATVWFKDPPRFGTRHYLEPQVLGGGRSLKSFESALGGRYFMPADGARLNKYGNIQPGQIKQILSVLGRSERAAGYQSDITARSAKRGPARDYFLVLHRRGGLVPGVWQRYVKAGSTKARGAGARARQWGSEKKGKFRSAVYGRGVRPVLIQGRAPNYRERFPFHEVAQAVADKRFPQIMAEAIRKAIETAR